VKRDAKQVTGRREHRALASARFRDDTGGGDLIREGSQTCGLKGEWFMKTAGGDTRQGESRAVNRIQEGEIVSKLHPYSGEKGKRCEWVLLGKIGGCV